MFPRIADDDCYCAVNLRTYFNEWGMCHRFSLCVLKRCKFRPTLVVSGGKWNISPSIFGAHKQAFTRFSLRSVAGSGGADARLRSEDPHHSLLRAAAQLLQEDSRRRHEHVDGGGGGASSAPSTACSAAAPSGRRPCVDDREHVVGDGLQRAESAVHAAAAALFTAAELSVSFSHYFAKYEQ